MPVFRENLGKPIPEINVEMMKDGSGAN